MHDKSHLQLWVFWIYPYHVKGKGEENLDLEDEKGKKGDSKKHIKTRNLYRPRFWRHSLGIICFSSGFCGSICTTLLFIFMLCSICFLLFFIHCVYIFETLNTSRYLSVCIPQHRIFLADILGTGKKERDYILQLISYGNMNKPNSFI